VPRLRGQPTRRSSQESSGAHFPRPSKQPLSANARLTPRSRRSVQAFNETAAAPKLNVAPINQALGLVDCFVIVDADQRLVTYKMPVAPDGISPVICHLRKPPLTHALDNPDFDFIDVVSVALKPTRPLRFH
jgi:hypothetical protein